MSKPVRNGRRYTLFDCITFDKDVCPEEIFGHVHKLFNVSEETCINYANTVDGGRERYGVEKRYETKDSEKLPLIINVNSIDDVGKSNFRIHVSLELQGISDSFSRGTYFETAELDLMQLVIRKKEKVGRKKQR